ncbi:MAG: multifunctional oxoglutarate decarboxylase/oxoglutarate dehydrogenase thiamine pyrophosphate-binding subunit/dihydrolipoyllysine-residue succinyltransferase subunit [Chloroflexi bacterium]|nr:MAG: multifunctional oxoglutarate decarboxylase/oxoglutarate dehydrogenase thiamine pyrophosphate-binding subunit/dihydrolipoyllysine-residue succinyltransferase subunit [Chloroflexota bacterium]
MNTATDPDQLPSDLNLINAGYVADLYELYRADPSSVDAEWRARFDAGFAGLKPVTAGQPPGNGEAPAAPSAPQEWASAPSASSVTPVTRAGGQPITGPAARLARNMTTSLAVPTATSFREIDVSLLEARRRELNDQLAPRKVSFTHLIGFAMVRAASMQRSMTHAYAETDGQPYRLDPGAVNLGLAVDVARADGTRFLLVPVIKGAETMDFTAFHARYEELVEKARSSRLSPDDLAGGTITLTNPGTVGTTASVPRLMAGQGTIVATGAIRSIGEQRLMTLTSTYDHRIIQGAESGQFLARIEASLTGQDSFYADVFGAMGAALGPGLGHPPQPRGPAQVASEATDTSEAVSASAQDLALMAAAMSLVDAYRIYGHLGASLDPLGSEPPGDPALDPAFHGLTPDVLSRIPASPLGVHVPGDNLETVLEQLRQTYSGTIAYEVEHIANHTERAWLRRVIESGEHRQPLSTEQRRSLLERLTAVEGFERFLHKAYLGQKRFSIEGLDTLVPMLDVILQMAAEQDTHRAVIGMAHRGRLNVLAHIVGVSYESILSEFEASRLDEEVMPEERQTDDVKYHLGASGRFAAAAGIVEVSVMPNPSHLEAVDPVVEGRARAEQTDRSKPIASVDTRVTLPILIHGDASFAAQGVVAETFNLSRLAGYANGGTVHLIANNQIGFTTAAAEARSTTYSSDLAKGFDVPIVHVNADDPEACQAAARLAMLYRAEFDGDMVIDLVGYRRYGHNEADEPAYTQPAMYRLIGEHPSVRELYLQRLEADGVVSAEDAAAQAKALARNLAQRQASVRKKATEPTLDRGADALPHEGEREPQTAVPAETLRTLNAQLYRFPREFTLSSKLEKQLARRRDALGDEGRIEWGHAESLAFGSLLLDGVPIRISGQDTVRGTFSQRHQTLFDAKTGDPFTPIQNLDGTRASFELHNSPLSEYAAMGFEYGYAVTAPEALVIWEAQYGDFANGAEIIIDQFLIAGLAKWRQTSRLTLLLPHGYEGQGPEHSSARLERFLALGAEGNIRVVYPTTAAQYFHLLRRQGRHAELRPLVVMTPKSLLRLEAAASRLSNLTDGAFRPVLDDPERESQVAAEAVRRVILCSGKVYYDVVGSSAREEAAHVAVVRVEQLYPFPSEGLRAVLDRYPHTERVAWVQEEPRNMGARKFVLPKIRHLVPYQVPLGDISRPERSRPAEGYHAAHAAEQARIVKEAFGA